MTTPATAGLRRAAAALQPAAGWAAAAVAIGQLTGRVDLGSQSLPLVLAAAWTGLWWPPAATTGVCLAAVLVFNWAIVPPVGSLKVDDPQHLLLLAVVQAVSLGVALLVSRQRMARRQAFQQAQRLQEQLQLGERLRAVDNLQGLRQALQQALQPVGLDDLALMSRRSLPGDAAQGADDATPAEAGELQPDERAGLQLCMAHGEAFGPGTGRYSHQPLLYLPLRGRHTAVGAAVLRPRGRALPGEGPAADGPDAATRRHAQALCDQAALVLERSQALHEAASQARQAIDQRQRSTLLAAVSHDHRTPLAAILGAASALREQGDRLDAARRAQLAGRIIDEVTQLGRLTDNALQLARLDAPQVQVAMDWESAEELVGSVLARVRQRDPSHRVRARVEPGLPLLHCNAVLMVQLLENLVDNALKASPAAAPVEVRVQQREGQLLLAVRDRGPGVPPAWRERIFEVFQRIEPAAGQGLAAPADARRPRGAGLGLAVCRAIARVHGGSLSLRARSHGGASFELRLPLGDAPPRPPDRQATAGAA